MISIIVPVFNCEKYIKECIESIINQTYKDWELLLIDDCSYDLSGKIIDEYAKKDNRIRAFHNEKNMGVGKTRNIGLDNLNGDYVIFIDSDDWITNDCLEFCINKLNEVDSDIIYFKWSSNKEDLYKKKKYFKKIYTRDQAIKMFLCRRRIGGYICGKMYKKSVVQNIRFSDERIGEDGIFSFLALLNVNKINYTEFPKYYYRILDNSASERGYFSDKMFDAIQSIDSRRKLLNNEIKLSKYFIVDEFNVYWSRWEKMVRFKAYKEYPKEFEEIEKGLKRTWFNAFFISINPKTKLIVFKYLIKKFIFNYKIKRKI